MSVWKTKPARTKIKRGTMQKLEAVNLAGQSVVYDEEKLGVMLVAVTKAYGLINKISPDEAKPLNEVHHLLYALMHGKIKQGRAYNAIKSKRVRVI